MTARLFLLAVVFLFVVSEQASASDIIWNAVVNVTNAKGEIATTSASFDPDASLTVPISFDPFGACSISINTLSGGSGKLPSVTYDISQPIFLESQNSRYAWTIYNATLPLSLGKETILLKHAGSTVSVTLSESGEKK